MATCIIRIYLPLKSNLTPNTGSAGHYDIQVKGTITFAGRTYTNPILSYAGPMRVYNNGDLTFSAPNMLCTIESSVSSFSPLVSWFNQYCQYVEKITNDESGVYDLYKVIDGKFEHYNKTVINCFAICAEWMSLMGDNTLLNIYNKYTWPNGTNKDPDKEGYMKYYSWAMFKTYYKNWNIVTLKV